MKKTHIAGIVSIVLLICIFGLWFWSLGVVASEDVPYMRLDRVEGKVEWKRKSDANWGLLDQSVDVRIGDSIRTSDDGKAEIRWGDRGVTRIDQSTRLTVEQVPQREIPATGLFIQLRVSTGRVWSRMLKLFDVQSSMQVESGGIVATIRGTAFGIAAQATSTDVAVSDSVVRVTPIHGTEGVFVREGRVGNFNATGTLNVLRDATDADQWVADNKRQDEQFDQQLQREIEQRFRVRVPGAPIELIDWSERLHLAGLSGDSRMQLLTAYAARHIAEMSLCSMDALCSDDVNRPVRAQELIAQIPENRRVGLVVDVQRGLFLNRPMPRIPIDSKRIGLLQSLRTQLLSSQRQPFSDALTIDDSIDAAFARGLTEPVRQRLIQSVSDWFASLRSRSDIPADELKLLRQKAISLDERLSVSIMTVTPSETNQATTSTRQTVSPSATTTRVVRVPGAPSPPSQTQPVSATTTPPLIMNLPEIQPATSTAPVKKTPRVPVSVTVGAQGLTTLTTGQRSPLTAYATYSDGTKMDVPYQCAWSTSDATIGIVTDAYFNALSGTGGATDVICAFSDAGVTVRGSLRFTVLMDPALQPRGTSAPTPSSPAVFNQLY